MEKVGIYAMLQSAQLLRHNYNTYKFPVFSVFITILCISLSEEKCTDE